MSKSNAHFGKFSDDGKEYVITDPRLYGRPWANYLTNEDYCCLITHTGGGFSWYRDCCTDRLLSWFGQNWQTDRPGRYIYIKDTETGELWSASWQPMRKPYQRFQTIHGLGYTSVLTQTNEIESEITYFVPQDDPLEVWTVRIRNNSSKQRTLHIYPSVEWLIGDSGGEAAIGNITTLFNKVGYDKTTQSILAYKTTPWRFFKIEPMTYNAFLTMSIQPLSYECHKPTFLGPEGDVANPKALAQEHLNNSYCDGERGVGVLQGEMSLKPAEEKMVVVLLGVAMRSNSDDEASSSGLISTFKEKYLVQTKALSALAKTKEYWQKRTSNFKVTTPDAEINNLINNWLPYQVHIANYWSRSPGLYHEGQGGRGYRDSCQDSEGMLAIDPEYSRKKLLAIARLVRRDGSCAPGWSDVYGPYSSNPCKDHPIWYVSSVDAYIKETGDKDFLNIEIPYLKDSWRDGATRIDPNWDKGAIEDGKGTVYEHILRQLDYTWNDTSVHGFPRIGHADWNDGIDSAGLSGVGESVWLAIALVRALKIAAELAEISGDKKNQKLLLARAEKMSERINKTAWDGEWYVRGYKDNKEVFGSSKNQEGKIYLNPQSWAIMAGVVPPERLEKMLSAVDKHLNTEYGLALFHPHYSVYDPTLGRIALFSPGTKENAAVFCHAATFMICALAMAGKGDKAYEHLRKIMPNTKLDINLYKTEPYVFAEYLVGPGHPYAFGEGAFTWLTGTAGWILIAMLEWIVGVRRTFGGLVIDPCLSSQWKEVNVTRRFRGDTYEVEIKNPDAVQKGVRSIEVDGKQIEGNLVRPFGDGKTHHVKVLMG